jgi:hypothetical protein
MRSGVIAQKVGMTRVFTETGEHIPVTVLKLGNCQVLGHLTSEKNGYVALQLGSGTRKTVYLPKAERGQFAVSKVEPKRKVAEFRVSEDALIPVGAEIQADHFVVGQFVDVTGTSVGKGFAGVCAPPTASRSRIVRSVRPADVRIPARPSRTRRCPVTWASIASPPSTCALCSLMWSVA